MKQPLTDGPTLEFLKDYNQTTDLLMQNLGINNLSLAEAIELYKLALHFREKSAQQSIYSGDDEPVVGIIGEDFISELQKFIDGTAQSFTVTITRVSGTRFQVDFHISD